MCEKKQSVKGFGKFIKKDNYVYRTEAYLQWGTSEKTIGTIIMQNPGAASEKGEVVAALREVELHLDPTMHSIKLVVEEAYKDQQLEGRVYIYNLFALQNPIGSQAIQMFNKLWSTNEPLICDLPLDREKLLERFNESSWIWLAWGCEDGSKHLRTKKELFLRESSSKVIGLPGSSKSRYYHPLARIEHRTEKFAEPIKQLFVHS